MSILLQWFKERIIWTSYAKVTRFEVSFVSDLNIYIMCPNCVHLHNHYVPIVQDSWVLDFGYSYFTQWTLVLMNSSLQGFPLSRSQRLKAWPVNHFNKMTIVALENLGYLLTNYFQILANTYMSPIELEKLQASPFM
jgi:hypothetical protein